MTDEKRVVLDVRPVPPKDRFDMIMARTRRSSRARSWTC